MSFDILITLQLYFGSSIALFENLPELSDVFVAALPARRTRTDNSKLFAFHKRITKNLATNSCIKLNIGGTVYFVRALTLQNHSETERLVKLARSDVSARINYCDSFIPDSNEYYFERSPKLFDSIFKFYLSGHLHRPLDVCVEEFREELTYWNISETEISSCCWQQTTQTQKDEADVKCAESGIECISVKSRTIRQRIYGICDGDGSRISNFFVFISISFVLISVAGLIIGSIKDFQIPVMKKPAVKQAINCTNDCNDNIAWEPLPLFTYTESLCICWFTMEYIVRFVVAPNRLSFFCAVMNIVDLLAIVPFFLEIALSFFGIDVESLSDIKGALLVVRVLRVLRVVRILKLGRYSSGMKTFALTLKSSARQLGMMGMVLSTGVVFFSTLLYFVEKDEPDSPFISIPAAFWWAIVTMTTVGYGDYVPVTTAGKLIACGAIISGVLVLALPITIIVDNFMKISNK
uniref:BTB domain-containing protein n=1 Tax=Syphacia muris TaxID=451379 RepID=A0A0N5A9Z2_9BILA